MKKNIKIPFYLILMFFSISKIFSIDHFIVITQQKTGSMILLKAINHLTELKFNRSLDSPKTGNNTNALELIMQAEKKKEFHHIHTNMSYFSKIYKPFSEDLRIKKITTVRDPRDTAISILNFYINEKRIYSGKRMSKITSKFLRTATNNQKLTYVIKNLVNTNKCLDFTITCLKDSNVLVIPFEHLIEFNDIIGKENQRQSLQNICDFLAIPYTKEHINICAENLFGIDKENISNNFSFRLGPKVNKWKEVFTPEHKELFKELYGRHLIELGYEKDDNW